MTPLDKIIESRNKYYEYIHMFVNSRRKKNNLIIPVAKTGR